MDEEKSQTEDNPICLGVDDLEGALDDHLLINLVASEVRRQRIFEEFTSRYRDSIEVQRIDGLMHDYGDLVDVLRKFSRPRSHEGETKVCILVDHWSEELIGLGDDQLFLRWFNDLDEKTHTLVLGTETPLASSASDRLRKLIPSRRLANMHITRPTVAKLSTAGVVAGAAGLGASLLKGLGPLSAATIPTGIAAGAVPAIVKALKAGSNGDSNGKEDDGDANDTSGRGAGDETTEGLTGLVSEELQKFLPDSLSRQDCENLEQLREIMTPSQRRELVAASTLENDVDESEYFGKLVKTAEEADRWAEFLRYLNQFDARIEEEAGEMGFVLDDDQGQHFATYLAKVGYEPQEFVASLFRTSDLVRLFPYFDPVEWEPQEFLDEQFQCWSHQESVMINEADTDADEENACDEVAPSTMEIPFRTGAGRPVRRLFQALKELNGAEALETNLKSVEDYAELKGPMEPRFCEWVYRRIECRELVDGLAGEILRPSDVRGLRKLWDLPVDETGSWPQSLHSVLAEIGVYEPSLPPHLDSGFPKVRQATKYFSEKTTPNIELETYDDQGSVMAARKGIERFLKLVVTFLWEGGLSEPILQVVVEGRQGFDPTALDAAELVGVAGNGAKTSKWSSADWKQRVDNSEALEDIQGATAGVLNHLLNALASECADRRVEPPFLRRLGDEQQLWSRPVFERIKSLITSLNKLMHDDLLDSEKERRRLKDGLPEKLRKVVDLVEDGMLRVPQPVQFFRRHDDGHGIHYEGYTDANDHLWFYEVEEEYELNEPYLFLAATNPSAVDVTCIPFPPAFQR